MSHCWAVAVAHKTSWCCTKSAVHQPLPVAAPKGRLMLGHLQLKVEAPEWGRKSELQSSLLCRNHSFGEQQLLVSSQVEQIRFLFVPQSCSFLSKQP